MFWKRVCSVAVLAGLLALSALSAGDGKDEMVENPMYKNWAGFKPGSTAVHVEKTTHKAGSPEGKLLPDNTDYKQVTYKLLKVDDKAAVVQVVVVEKDFLGYIESAPTKLLYPAKVKKSELQAIKDELSAKKGEETVKALGKDMKCQTLTGASKKGDQVSEHKVWYSSAIPGALVKRTRVTKQGDAVVLENLITLKAYKVAE